MTTVWVVPAFYEFKDRHAGLSLGTEYAPVNELAFKCSEKAFRHSVVKTIPYRAHRRRDTHLPAAFPECVGGILATLIAVINDADWTELPQCHVERLDHQLGTQVIGHRPAHQPPAEGVDDDRQKQESGPGRHVGDVGNPKTIRRIGFEPALNEVRSWTEPVVAARVPLRLDSPASRISRINLATRLRPMRITSAASLA